MTAVQPIDPMDHSFQNSERPPDWKWRRAMGAVAGTEPGPSRRWDKDANAGWIKRAIRFIERYEDATTVDKKYALADKFPDIFWAHKMFVSTTNIIKYSIEAHVLAGSTNRDIAMRTNCADKTVDTYCQLFFDVRDRLGCTQWVVHSIIGVSVHNGLAERQYDLLWKLYGLMMGPQMLDALETKFVNPNRPATADAVGNAIEDDVVSTMKLKASLAAKGVSANNATYGMLLDRFIGFVEIERNSDSQGQAQSSILQTVDTMLNKLPFRVGLPTERINGRVHVITPKTEVEEFEQTAVELTYAELMQASAGQNLLHPDKLRAMKFPDPPSSKP